MKSQLWLTADNSCLFRRVLSRTICIQRLQCFSPDHFCLSRVLPRESKLALHLLYSCFLWNLVPAWLRDLEVR